MFFARNWFVQPKFASPECFVAERIKTEHLSAIGEHLVDIGPYNVLKWRSRVLFW